MKKSYNPITIANRLIELAEKDGRLLTPMQLIKLTYIAHGFSLAILKGPLIDENVEAWRYGPVIPSLYRRLKKYGSRGVSEILPPAFFGLKTQTLEGDDERLVDLVFEKYGTLSGPQLSHLTHREGTPWQQNYHPNEMGTEIDDQLIRAHYKQLLGSTH